MFAVVMAFLAPILHSSCNLLDSHFANNLIKSNSAIIFYNSLTNVVAIPFLLLFGLPQQIAAHIKMHLGGQLGNAVAGYAVVH